MTREEIINEYFTEHRYDILLNPYASLLDFAKYLDEHSELPEGLEEAAEEYRRETCNEACKNGFLDNYPSPSIKTAFIAGAEYQRKQDQSLIELAEDHAMLAGMNKMKQEMLEKAVEGIARPDDCEIWVNLTGYGYKFKDGDRVKVIVIPEEK